MKTEEQTPPPAPHSLEAFISCPEWGTGGTFEFDPATGKRTRIGDAPAPAGSIAVAIPEAGQDNAGAIETTAQGEASASAATSGTTSVKKGNARG